MRGLLRWLSRIALTGLALMLLGLGVSLVTAHTAWGREQLRRRIEAALQGAFPGGARVTALDGSILGTLTLRGVELDRPEHGMRVTAGALHARVALWPLVFQTARLDRLEAEDLRVIVREPSPQQPPPGEPSAWRVELLEVAIRGATVEIERARLVLGDLDAAGGAAIAGGHAAFAGVAHGRWSRADGPWVELSATGTVAIDAAVHVAAALVTLDGAAIAATALTLDVDHPTGSIAAVASTQAIARLVPEIGCGAPEEREERGDAAVQRTVPCAAPGLADVATAIELAADGPDATRATIVAAAGDARLRAALRGEPARRTARILASAGSIDLAPMTRGRLRGRGNLIAALDAGGSALGGARGVLIAHGELDVADLPVRRAGVVILGNLDDATVLAVGRGDDALQVAAVAAAHLRSGAVVVDDARAVATAHAVQLPCQREGLPDGVAPAGSAAAPRCRHLTGELTASARIAGQLAPRLDLVVAGIADGNSVAIEPAAPGDGPATAAALRSPFVVTVTGGGREDAGLDVAIAGDIAGATLALADITVAAARGSYALGAVPDLRLDRARVTATGIRRAGRSLGNGQLDIERHGSPTGDGTYGVAATARLPIEGVTVATAAEVRAAGSKYIAALGDSRVTLAGGAWSGRGGTLIVSDPTTAARALALGGVTLRRGDAAVALRGDYAGATGALRVRLDGERLDASILDAGARGIARGTLDLGRRGGRWSADAALAVAGLARSPGAAPVDATAHVVLAGPRLTLEAHATGAALGDIDLLFEATPPRDPLELAAWRRLDRDAIHTAAITARRVALVGLADLIGSGAAPAGTLDGKLDLAPAALHGGLTVRGVELPFGVVEGEATFAPHDGDLGAHATVRIAGVADVDLTARLALPPHPFEPATWRRRGRDLVRGAAADVEDVAFDPALLARLGIARWLADRGITAPYRGRARAVLALGAAAGEARLAVDLTDVTGGALLEPVASRLELGATRSGSHLHATLGGAGLGLGVLEADAAVTLERWLDEPSAVLAAPLTAQWTLPAIPLAPVLGLLGRRELQAGTLEGSATIHGTVGAPRVSDARLVARDVALSPPIGGRTPPVIREIAARVTWNGTTGHVALDGRESSGGEIHASLTGRPDALAAASGTARLTRLDVAPLVVFLPGALVSAAGILDGDLALHAGRITGQLHITDGALPLAARIGTLRDAIGDVASDGRTITAALKGRLGRGTIDLTANAAADLATATVTLHLDRVSPIVAMRPVISGRATAQLYREAYQLRGEVTVEPGGSIALTSRSDTPLLDAVLPSDLVFAGASVADPPRSQASRASQTSGSPQASGVVPSPQTSGHPWLVVDVRPGAIALTARELKEGAGLSATLTWPLDEHGSLPCGPASRLRVSIGDTVGVCGRVAIHSDDIEILGRRYRVEPTRDGTSGVAFDGTIDPLLHLRMSHRFPDLTLTVDLSGRLSNLDRPRFSGDGTYSQDQLFGFFLGGEPGGDASSPTRDRTRNAVAGAGARWLSGKLGRQISKVLPISVDTLSCEPDPAATATTATAGSCTVGKWLSEQLFVAYRQRLQPRADENTGDVQFQLRMGERLLLEGTGGDRGHYGADLLWRHRW